MKKESKWKKKRTKAMKQKKGNGMSYAIVICLFTIGSIFTYNYATEMFFSEEKAVAATESIQKENPASPSVVPTVSVENRQTLFLLPKEKPLSPIDFEYIEKSEQ